MEEKEKMITPEQSPEETASAEAVATPVEEAPEQTSTTGADEKKEKPMTKKKKILNGIVLGVQIALVVLALVICLVVILNPNPNEVSGVGIKLMPVRTGSMDGTRELNGKTYKGFPAGSLVIATKPKNGGKDLQVGDVVTFMMREEESNEYIPVTHRIIERNEHEDGTVDYVTQGDANPTPDKRNGEIAHRIPGDMLAKYSFHIKGLGSAFLWIKDGYHFIFVIIIPLALLLIYNIYLVAQIVVENKMRKAKAAAAETAKAAALASIDEEEIKRRAIEEYLRNQTASAGSSDPDDNGGEN